MAAMALMKINYANDRYNCVEDLVETGRFSFPLGHLSEKYNLLNFCPAVYDLVTTFLMLDIFTWRINPEISKFAKRNYQGISRWKCYQDNQQARGGNGRDNRSIISRSGRSVVQIRNRSDRTPFREEGLLEQRRAWIVNKPYIIGAN